MADIQSAAAEIRRGIKKERRRKKKPQSKNIMPALLHRAAITTGQKYNVRICCAGRP